ncbi:choline ABC transporter substrate-binding protein [Pseudomonas sp. LRF_L74]|uniref:choline ABC transporter substrate-binding protein n=1 Tax=Pseudomonas sp. LRF_L74 TaxID=3369422 RepID=UPI003F648FC2
MTRLKCWLFIVVLVSSSGLYAADPEQCSQIRLPDVGWTDITMTTAVARLMFNEIGYGTQVKRMSLPDTYQALGRGDMDVFLGNWMPAQSGLIEPYLQDGRIESLQVNLAPVRYTLAVLDSAYQAGLRDFADIHRYKDQLRGQIYGIEPGNKGNEMIKEMIRSDTFGLKGFSLVESNESGMLNYVERAQKLNQWAVFLGWEPHPMNDRLKMKYLSGGDKYFGPDFGAAKVVTVTRKGFAAQCPNAAKLLHNMRFTIAAENQLMAEVLAGNTNRRRVALQWLESNPEVVRQWLEGVSRRDGSALVSVFEHKIAIAR